MCCCLPVWGTKYDSQCSDHHIVSQEAQLSPTDLRDALYQLKRWPTVVRITETDGVSAWGTLKQLPRFIHYLHTCIVAVGSTWTIAQSVCDAPCHIHVTLKWPWVSSADFRTTNPVNINWTVTVINQLRLSPMLLMKLRIPPQAHRRGRGRPWRMDTNFRR